MPFTYTWANLVTVARGISKNVPFPSTTVEAMTCDLVSGTMYNARAEWRWPLTTIAAGAIPLQDGLQDYDVPATVSRITKLFLKRTDTTPDQIRDLELAQDLAEDLTSRSWESIQLGAHQAAVGKIRLESAVQISSGVTIEIGGEFQPAVTKITATTQGLWFPDDMAEVAIEGLLYWLYKHSNDDRAGTAAADETTGETRYSGQLATFMGSIRRMARAQDSQGISLLYPSESMGAERSINSFSIFG